MNVRIYAGNKTSFVNGINYYDAFRWAEDSSYFATIPEAHNER